MKQTLAALLLLTAGCGTKSEAEPVTIFAAASLREAVTEIGRQWTQKTGRAHRLQFEASSTLARQIRNGAPADVFISASPEWMDEAAPLERRDWLGNRLVCVVPAATRDFDLKAVRRFALADEQVPAGKYAKTALAAMAIKPIDAPLYGHNVRDVMAKVSQGGADAGIVYATDAVIDSAVRVAFTFPEESHPKIVYPAGLLKERGRDFYNTLFEPWALEIARRSGFSALSK